MVIHFTFKHFLQYLGMQLLEEFAYIGFCLELADKLLTLHFVRYCLILFFHNLLYLVNV